MAHLFCVEFEQLKFLTLTDTATILSRVKLITFVFWSLKCMESENLRSHTRDMQQ